MIREVSYCTLWCDCCNSRFEYYDHDDKMDIDEWGWQNEFVNKKELIRLAMGEGWHFFKSGKVLCPDCYAKRK